MDGGEHHECCRALLDERACREDLQRKGEEIQGQEYPEFISACTRRRVTPPAVRTSVQVSFREGDAPTAAFLRPVNHMRNPTTNTLNPHARMFAMFPNEPFPTFKMPHSGLIPTGAVAGLADNPTRTDVPLFFCSYMAERCACRDWSRLDRVGT